MNERIKELMEDSGLHIAYENKTVTEKELEFFAESIIRECADVAFLEANSRKVQRSVLQHFGVK